MSRRGSNPVVLNFHESLLRLSDIELLNGHCWLNDSVISFYFEYLEISRYRKNPALLFVPPQVTQCIKLSPSTEVSVFLEPLISNRCRFIFFALNDNEQTEVSGGSHWSLLVFSEPERMVFHFDSSKGSNCEQAMEFGAKLLRYLRLSSYGFREPLCLQQSNGYDCGIHVMCNAENIADFASKHQKVEGCSVLKEDIVQSKRHNLLNLITNLAKTS
ncbi:hypothetical protein RI129_010461 [Pyrocoelia pectoralis]|uniref:Ubiquitin-like protease family profile domain-containing protein n=1 Tax=Pyrocoelia pectoralis TaxID=417401 RepID=A0AAN7VEI6_9COLE